MKRNIILLLIMVISVVAYGQRKPKVNKALKAVQDGELGEAKEIIDAAIEHRKTKDDAKTWYYRALIYAALDTTENASYQNLDKDPLRVSVEAFDKASALNEGNNELYITGPNGFPQLKSQQVQVLWGHYLNKGVVAFQENNSEKALKNFERCQIVLPQDTTCYFYAGLAAQNSQNFDKAAENYYKLINDLDHHDPDVYNSLIYIEANIRKNDEKALELIRRAKERWPNNPELAKTEINVLIRLDRLDEARAELQNAIKNEPDNPDLYFSLGVMQDEVGNTEKAIEAYKNAVEIDPNHLNANFNLAVIYFNQAVQTFKERNSLGINSADMKKGKELKTKGDEQLRKALPYWEKVRENDPSNRVALEQLRYIYIQLKQNEKAEKIQNEMDQYGYTDEG
jgi:tetratricopeptide (TPR) repeat protein